MALTGFLALAATAAAAQVPGGAGDAPRPPASSSTPAATPVSSTPLDKRPVAIVVQAPYRFDDLIWENDRTVHRIYGRALEGAEPPSGSGIDSWGKNVVWPFADRHLRTGDQHRDNGEGLDFYHVGTTRGAGGLGIWWDNKLWTSRNYVRPRILHTGGDLADFTVDYDPWPVGTDRTVRETRRFTLRTGTHFTRLQSTIASNRPGDLLVGIGIGRRTTGPGAGDLTVDRAAGIISWWGPEEGANGRMAVALKVDPSAIAEIRQDADNELVLLRVTPGRPFVYYTGSAWSLGQGGFHNRAGWDRYVSAERTDFVPWAPPK